MRRLVRWSFFALLIWAALAGTASATTYYIAANGSDSNNGTSKSTPWLHAPGMPGCSGTCGSTTPRPGDSFIFRGGDTWHTSSGSPVGMPWSWKWSGSSGNAIYIGVDTSWSAGGSWTRPVLSMDNPLTTSRPSGCTFDDTNITSVTLGSQNYVTFDNFEFIGRCWAGATSSDFVNAAGNHVTISSNYFHGWTYASSSIDDSARMIAGNMSPGNTMLITLNVFDGSDSSLGTTAGQASGFALGSGSEISFNVFNHVSNGMIANPASVHDNLFQYMYEPQGEQHGNIIETVGPASATGPIYIYNNVLAHTNEGVGYWLETNNENIYIFNNVVYHWRENANGSNGTDGSNCYMVDKSSNSVNIYFYNNTNDSPCDLRTLNGARPTINLANNHYIGYPSATMSATLSGGAPTIDNGHHVFQTEAAANGQGYVPGNNYAPTAAGDSTVGAGADQMSFCSAIGSSTPLAAGALAACARGMGGVTYNTSSHTANPVTTSATRTAAEWDAGAYEFGSASSTNKPKPPTGLLAVVQ